MQVPYNIYMIARFPFLRPKICYLGKYCWYRNIPTGWRKAFGIQLCKEIKESLKRSQCNFTITDVKEKFGALNIYSYGASDEIQDIINKYEYISAHTCIECGRIATRRSQGYILPYCNNCSGNHIGYSEYYKDYSFYG